MEKEILVISDIHGRGDEFKLLIRRILKYIDRYKIILLGDYVGYGRNNIEVIKMLKYLKENSDCVILKGNWEDMFYSYIRHRKSDDELIQDKIGAFISRGGVNTANELFSNRQALNYYIDLIEEMPTYHIEKINGIEYLFAHSGINIFKYIDNENLDMQTEEDMLWNFDFYYEAMNLEEIIVDFPFKIVAGHVPTPNLMNDLTYKGIIEMEDSVFGVDFGASKSKGQLGLVNLSKEGMPFIYEDVKPYRR